MKLSQKLLGLAGLAMADYACCPYDDYGMPHGACSTLLSEKTPFVGGAQQSFVGNACKAWETNVDAQYEGNSRSSGCAMYNWGSCGFQRHFPWRDWTAAERTTLSLGDSSTNLLTIDVDLANGNANGINTGAFSATGNKIVTETNYHVGARPFLGGMCKLFVPVPATQIVQVQVAGVHKPAGVAQYPGRVNVANAASLEGTVYCFGVANIAEAMDNTNDILNGNVAGDGVAGETGVNGRNDPFNGLTSLNRQAGVAYTLTYGGAQFGEQDNNQATAAEQIIAEGANFDVVAHFTDAFCESSGGVVEMQLAGDENDDDTNYILTQNSGFSHAHNDVYDKRHTTPGYGDYWADSTLTTGYLAANGQEANEAFKWPNRGAWAAYYSTVICARTSQAFGGANDPQKSLWTTNREYILSVSANDFRRNDDGQTGACTSDTTTHRFNLRQVGNNIQACGPGTLPDQGGARCTWNWTYAGHATTYGASNANDPEGFFDRSDQMVVDTWSARKRRDLVLRQNTLGGSSVVTTQSVAMTLKFRDNAGNDITTTAASADDNKVSAQAGSTTVITVDCNAGTIPAGGNQRDAFPDCFQGDEVHFEISYVPCSDPSSCTETSLINNWFSIVHSSQVV